MKKRVVSMGLAICLLIGSLALIGCGEPKKVEAPKHEHTFVNGVCPEDGAYETEFILRGRVTESLKAAPEKVGTIEELTYTTHSYYLESLPENEGKEIVLEKTALVYLPSGYDASKTYNVMYLLHGTGEDEKCWLTFKGKDVVNVMENMAAQGLCDPVIIVTPTWYSPETHYASQEEYNNDPNPDGWTSKFAAELRNDLIPAVEAKYATYAKGDTSSENLIATRDHRAFCGVSRGSMTVMKSGMMQNVDYIANFGNFSGVWTEVSELKEALTNTEFASYPIHFWYNGTGDADTVGGANESHPAFYKQAMTELSDKFTDGMNAVMIIKKSSGHDYNAWLADFYNAMLRFYK
ncbi:MAG: alpha/beta hydrolase-fold protein [Clostridia bacterium]|nr:alpha/beta hydrolase-fold protein [Clostridia bacterium]